MANPAGDSEVWLPYEFPYEYGVSSPVSTETESSDEEEDFLAGLTQRLSHSTLLHDTTQKQRQLTKTRDLAGSPQSTLTGMGGRCGGSGDGSPNSHSGVPSDPWEVIYAAAGQVARLKMHAQVSQLHFQNNQYQVSYNLLQSSNISSGFFILNIFSNLFVVLCSVLFCFRFRINSVVLFGEGKPIQNQTGWLSNNFYSFKTEGLSVSLVTRVRNATVLSLIRVNGLTLADPGHELFCRVDLQ